MPVHGFPDRPHSRTRTQLAHRKTTPGRGRILRLALLILLPLALLLGLFFGIGFTWQRMVRDGAGKTHARWALVLDGWVPDGERALRGYALARAGQADSVLLSGSKVGPGVWASTFQFRALGLPKELSGRFGELRHGAHSTIEEAQAATLFFRARRVDTVLLVTSDYHTDRAASVFHRVSGGKPLFLVTPAIEERFAHGWDRERLKTWLLESTKRLEWFSVEKWVTPPLGANDTASVPWRAALGDSAGSSPLFRSACPPTPVCPPPVVCPVCPNVATPVVAPCPELSKAVEPAKKAEGKKSEKKVEKKSAKPEPEPKKSKHSHH